MKEYMLKQVDYHAWANIRLFDRIKELPNYEAILLNRYRAYSLQSRILLRIFILQIKCGYILHGKSMNEAIQDRENLRKRIETKSLYELEKLFENMANQYKDF